MDTVTFLWSLSAAFALMLAMVATLAWLSEPRNRIALVLGVVGLAAAASAYIELRMMHSATPAEYGHWLRWYNLSVYCALGGLLAFVHYYLGTGRIWLLSGIVLARSVLVIVNFCVFPNINFREILTLDHVSILGVQVSTVGAAVIRSWQWVAVGTMLLLIVYLLDAVAQRRKSHLADSRGKALVVGLGIAAPMICTAGTIHMVVFGALHIPVFDIPSLLGALCVAVYELRRAVVAGRRARIEISELRTQLTHLGRLSLMGQLTATLVHELAQPLTASVTNSEVALLKLRAAKPDLPELRDILADIRSCDARSADLIGRMRQFFRRRTLEMQRINLGDVVQDVASLVRSQVTSRKISLDLRVQPELPSVSGDRVHLTQVLLNLVMNGIEAVQSRPLGGRRIVIDAQAHAGTREVEMSVRDSGPGIPPGVADKVFQPFFTTKHDGMGMGLALSRSIIEAHGGRLWSESASHNGGAAFCFTLRYAQS
jgi:signal transduction histidine kinase